MAWFGLPWLVMLRSGSNSVLFPQSNSTFAKRVQREGKCHVVSLLAAVESEKVQLALASRLKSHFLANECFITPFRVELKLGVRGLQMVR